MSSRSDAVQTAPMVRAKRPGLKVLFVGEEEALTYTDGVGELLIEPVTAAIIVARVREMLVI